MAMTLILLNCATVISFLSHCLQLPYPKQFFSIPLANVPSGRAWGDGDLQHKSEQNWVKVRQVD